MMMFKVDKGCHMMNYTRSLLATFCCLGLLLAKPVWGAQIVWFDGADPSTILDAEGDNAASGNFSGSVVTWIDKAGGDNNADGMEHAPTYNPTGLNGMGVVNFDNQTLPAPLLQQWMEFPAAHQGPTGITAFIVSQGQGTDDPAVPNSDQVIGSFDTWLAYSGDGDIFLIDRGDINTIAFGTNGNEGRAEGDPTVYHIITAKFQASDGAITARYNGANQVECEVNSVVKECFNPDGLC